MDTLATLVSRLAAHPAPALTQFSDEGRIELGGPTLARWACKISGYLLSDLALERGARVSVRLPTHWRALAWGLGVVQAGGRLAVGPNVDPAGAAVACCAGLPDIEAAWDAGVDDVVAQVLPSLALAWEGDLPDGCEDAQRCVMSQPDALMVPPHPWEPRARPIEGEDATFADLLTPWPGVDAGDHIAWSSVGTPGDLVRAIRVWAAGAHAVIVAGPLANDLLATERARPLP